MSQEYLPRDVQQYFDVPAVTVVVLSNTPALVIRANPDRIGLIFSCNNVGNAFVSPSKPVATLRGIMLPTAGTNLLLDHRTWGNLVQVEWYGSGQAGAELTIVEVFLPRSPIDR